MSDYLITENSLTALADGVRNIAGTEETYSVEEMGYLLNNINIVTEEEVDAKIADAAANLQSFTLQLTFAANQWSGEAPPFTQSVTLAGPLDVGIDEYPIVDVNLNNLSDIDQINTILDNWNLIDRMTIVETNLLTAYCYSEKPTVDIPFIVKVVK